jgi:transcriptional activator SPT8
MQETNTDLSTTTDDDDDDDIDNSNDIDNELESQLQQELAMEVDAELEAEANELDAALLAEDPSVNASTSTQTTSTLDMREQGSHGRANELLPLPGPILDDHDHTGLGASPGRSRASSAPRGAGPSRQGSTSPPPALGIPSRRKKGSPSPASKRHAAVAAPVGLSTFTTKMPRTYQVEAICALPHPVPTHALACSYDMTHLLTGSDDGYIRDYDIFTAVNSKTFLSAPQRHHAGVVEGLMKAGQLRFWWENPGFNQRRGFIGGQAIPPLGPVIEEEPGLSPVYSLLMHSDALWALAGTDVGSAFVTPHISLTPSRQGT